MADARRHARASKSGALSPHDAEDAASREVQPDHDGSRNTLRYIILGLLGAHPMSGYDIKRAFDRSLATYWNAGNSQIYTTLKVLATRGLVSSDLVLQEGRPNRRVYRLTPTGRAALDAWLVETVPPASPRMSS